MKRMTRWFVLSASTAMAASSLALVGGAGPAAASGADYGHFKKVQRHLLSGQVLTARLREDDRVILG